VRRRRGKDEEEEDNAEEDGTGEDDAGGDEDLEEEAVGLSRCTNAVNPTLCRPMLQDIYCTSFGATT